MSDCQKCVLSEICEISDCQTVRNMWNKFNRNVNEILIVDVLEKLGKNCNQKELLIIQEINDFFLNSG